MNSIQDYFGGTSTADTSAGPFDPGTLNDIGTGLTIGGDIVGGIAGYYAGQAKAGGLRAESRAYTEAAGFASGNVQLAEESKAIKDYLTQRQVLSAEGKQIADVGGAGFAESGSALSLLRESAAQGALATGLVNVQGEIQAQGYRAQAANDISLASQAKSAAGAAEDAGTAALIGGIFKAGAAVVPFL